MLDPQGLSEDSVCGPIRGIAMVRRRNRVDISGPRIRARGYRAMSIAANVDRFAGEPVFKARPPNVRRSCGTDPGPAGFDWVEIDFSSAPLANGRDDS